MILLLHLALFFYFPGNHAAGVFDVGVGTLCKRMQDLSSLREMEWASAKIRDPRHFSHRPVVYREQQHVVDPLVIPPLQRQQSHPHTLQQQHHQQQQPQQPRSFIESNRSKAIPPPLHLFPGAHPPARMHHLGSASSTSSLSPPVHLYAGGSPRRDCGAAAAPAAAAAGFLLASPACSSASSSSSRSEQGDSLDSTGATGAPSNYSQREPTNKRTKRWVGVREAVWERGGPRLPVRSLLYLLC